MDALVKAAELEVPKSLVAGEIERMIEATRADLKKRGVKDADTAPIPAEMFQAAGRAPRPPRPGGGRAGAQPTTCRPSPSSCRPTSRSWRRATRSRREVVRWYLSDRNRMAEVEAIVVENNVAAFVLEQGQGRPTRNVPFDELMAG